MSGVWEKQTAGQSETREGGQGSPRGPQMATFLRDLIQYQKLLQMVFVLGIGGSFQMGFQVSMITFTSPHVKAFLNASWLARSGDPSPPQTLTLLWSLVVSAFALGGLFGSMASGFLATKYGKKRCLLASNVAMLASALLLSFSREAASFELILAGRFLCGACVGVSLPLHPQYLGEVSPKTLRGFANASASSFWSLGKVFGQIMGQREVLGGACWWPVLMAFGGFPALAQLLTLPFFPESPPHLFLRQGDEEGCRKAMKTYWGEGRPWQHQEELEDLRREKESRWSARSHSVWGLAKDRSLRCQLYLLVLIVVATQLNGVQAIYSYTFEVLSAAGFKENHIPYLSMGLSSSELLSTLLCSAVIDRFGRRILLWGGYCIMATMLAALTLTLSLQHLYPWIPYCSLGLIFGLVFSFGMGPAGATSSVRMELFDQSSRASSFVVGGVLSWAGTCALGLAFPPLAAALGPPCFLLFAGALGVCGALVFRYLPETKKKSILEIRREFGRLNFAGKDAGGTGPGGAATTFCTQL